jgi:hypothetical protein
LFRIGFIWVFFCCAASILCLRNSAAELSLAIISEDESALNAADVLTAELSALPNVRLLERDQLRRIIAEQRLSLVQSIDLLAAGRLAGADAIVFMDHYSRTRGESGEKSEYLGIRTILAKEGVLLDTGDFPWPTAEISEWARTTAKHLQPTLTRANSREGNSVKLSLLSLRSPTDSRETRLLDRELNALLLKRLARETNVFVLERQKLGATFLERELNSETSPFWRGSHLIDGTVNKLGYSTNQITIEGRVVPPGAQKTNIVQIAGKPSELPQMIDQFVREVLKSAEGTATSSWDPAAEAARYFEEAGWALRWGLLSEAQSAADAAWALGKQDEATAILRVQGYGRAAEPERAVHIVHGQRRRVSFSKPPQLGAVQNGITALSVFLERSTGMGPQKATMEWLNAGHKALRHASELLYRYYFMAEARSGLEEDLAELRALCREAATWMAKAPLNRAAFFLENPELTFDEINQALEREHLFKTMAEFGALWQERMPDALALHRMIITAPAYPVIRDLYLGEDFTRHLPLAGWTWDERQKALPTWRDFLLELEKNTNIVTQIEAKMLRTRIISEDEPRFALVREIAELIRANAKTLAHYPVLLKYNYGFDDLVRRPSGLNIVTERRGRLERELRDAGSNVFEPLDRAQWANADARRENRKTAGLFEEQKIYLAELRTDPGKFPNLFLFPRSFPKQQAETLLVMLAEYRSALSNSLATAESRNEGKIRIALLQSAQAEDRIAKMLGKTNVVSNISSQRPRPAMSTNRVSGLSPGASGSPNRASVNPPNFPVKRFGPPGAPGMADPPFAPAEIRTNHLVISSFHEIPTRLLTKTNLQFYRNTSFLVDGEKVWLRNRYTVSRPETGYRSEPGGLIIAFDPKSGIGESIETGFEPRVYLNMFSKVAADFQIWNGDFYAAGGTQLQRYDQKAKRWTALPVPVSKNAQVSVADGRLLVLNAESLLEIGRDGGAVRTLASSRRQPAITPLDLATNLADGLILGADEGFRVWVPPTLYQFREGEFTALQTFGMHGRRSSDPNGFLYVERSANFKGEIAQLVKPSDTKAIAYFTQTQPGMPEFGRQPEPENVHWKGLNRFFLAADGAVFHGDDILLWGLPKTTQVQRVGPQAPVLNSEISPHPCLLLLSPRFKEPVAFSIETAPGVPGIWENQRRVGLGAGVFMAVTKTHLAIGTGEQRGLWFVPLAELFERANEAKIARKENLP